MTFFHARGAPLQPSRLSLAKVARRSLGVGGPALRLAGRRLAQAGRAAATCWSSQPAAAPSGSADRKRLTFDPRMSPIHSRATLTNSGAAAASKTILTERAAGAARPRARAHAPTSPSAPDTYSPTHRPHTGICTFAILNDRSAR